MLVIEDRVSRLRTLMLARWHVFNILTGRSVTRIVVVVAIRLGDSMMRIGLVVLELICVVFPER
jgi:hypothetical protein